MAAYSIISSRDSYTQLAFAMKLSSLDIRKQQFSRIVRGYDRDEVDAFLDMVGTQWQELIDENRRSDEKIKEMQVKLEHYQKVEEALEEAIKSARDNAEKKIKDAEKSATAIMEKAEARAVKITIGAEEERLKIKRETARYSIRQKEMLTKFRSFLSSELEMLAYHEKNDTLRMPELEPLEAELSTTEATPVVPTENTDSASLEAPEQDESPVATDESHDTEESVPEMEAEAPEAAVEYVDEDQDQKSSWTVNTLVSPEAEGDAAKNEKSAHADRPATPPNGDMRAAQEEIENLRKLLKDLE